ncbi:glycosyltransferase family 2 protein [Streptomyces sp. NPDC017941]|uniref:glycosyltransferase family 2 protein n=1 Tax=unclassified Streptomyces TaxID=2593676 RepID=UPI0037BD2702
MSVITPVYDGGHQYLSEAYESLATQEMPPGWEWEWIVQEDGQTQRPASFLPGHDSRVKFASGPRAGAGAARTLGLGRASGSIVRALDADDLFTPGALSREIAALDEDPSLGWCISGCLDLLPDGRLTQGPSDPPAGPLPYETLRAEFEADAFPVVGTHLAARKELVLLAGGWPPYPALEALALVLVCAAMSPGKMLGTPGGVYRKHSEQTTGQADYAYQEADAVEYLVVKKTILTRLDSLTACGWKWSPMKQGESF